MFHQFILLQIGIIGTSYKSSSTFCVCVSVCFIFSGFKFSIYIKRTQNRLFWLASLLSFKLFWIFGLKCSVFIFWSSYVCICWIWFFVIKIEYRTFSARLWNVSSINSIRELHLLFIRPGLSLLLFCCFLLSFFDTVLQFMCFHFIHLFMFFFILFAIYCYLFGWNS